MVTSAPAFLDVYTLAPKVIAHANGNQYTRTCAQSLKVAAVAIVGGVALESSVTSAS